MHCHYHPERPVERECRLCHELVCSDCVVNLADEVVCKTCLAEKLTLQDLGVAPMSEVLKKGQPAPEQSHVTKGQEALNVLRDKNEQLNQRKSSFLTVLFSILPGLGHFYLGLQQRAMSLMIIFFVVLFLNTIVPSGLVFPIAIAIPILWFYAQFDALKYKALINIGESFEDEPITPALSNIKASWLGYLLLLYGVLALLDNVLDYAGFGYEMRRLFKELLSAGVLITIGYWVVTGKFGSVLNKDSEDRKHA